MPADTLPYRARALREEMEPLLAGATKGRFRLIVHQPGMMPSRKGSWPLDQTASILREFIKAYPRAYLHVLTVDEDGAPWVEHGPEVLKMLDGRSMSVGRKHNARTRAAHVPLIADQAARIADLEARVKEQSDD